MGRHFVLNALLIASVGLPSFASAARNQQEVEGRAPEIVEPDRRRILSFEDGSLLRARTRKLEEGWEQRQGKLWVPIRRGVASARLERELLAQSRTLAARTSKKEPAAQVTLAGWMADHGLSKEALAVLDRVLTRAPDYEAAHKLLQRAPLILELPGDPQERTPAYVQALVIAGAQRGPAHKELCIRKLAEMQEVLDLDSLVRAELLASPHRRRAFAALVAQRLRRGLFLRELSDRAILDKSSDARRAAALALGAANEVSVLGPAIRALSSKHPLVRSYAATAMGNMGYAAAVAPLMANLASLQSGGASGGVRANLFVGGQTAYVRDYDVEIAQSASIADPIIGVQSSGVSFDVRATPSISPGVEIQSTVRSLGQLTGAHPGNGSPAAWMEWWQNNQREWRESVLAGKGAGSR